VRPSSSRSELFSAVEARGGVAEATGDRAWLQAMLDFEAGLARVQARAGVISPAEADAIAKACDADRFDAAEIGAAAAEIGNPAGPIVKALREIGPAHKGATSQDVLDTAAMLVAKRALEPLLADLQAAAGAAARLAAEHRDTVMAGRTLLQQAEPITFGLKAAGWMTGLDTAAARLRSFRPAVQLGGAAGTGDPQIRAALATELGLEDAALAWHTERTRIGELASGLAIAAGAAGKVARDITLLAQTEV
jgi:3-carboxy-cis,cis-muconate cycloisomerase